MMTNTAHIHAKHLQLNITTKKFHMLRNKFFLLNVYHCHHFPSSLMFFLAMYSNQEHFSSHPISHTGPAHLHQVPPALHHYLKRGALHLLLVVEEDEEWKVTVGDAGGGGGGSGYCCWCWRRMRGGG